MWALAVAAADGPHCGGLVALVRVERLVLDHLLVTQRPEPRHLQHRLKREWRHPVIHTVTLKHYTGDVHLFTCSLSTFYRLVHIFCWSQWGIEPRLRRIVTCIATKQKNHAILYLYLVLRYISYLFCFRYDTLSGWPSRIQPLKWPIFEQNPSTFGWDMTQNGNKMFWVISQPNIDGFSFNMGHLKGWILLGRPDTVLYRKHNNEHEPDTESNWVVWYTLLIRPNLVSHFVTDKS